jgi:hypothetical protein
MYAWYFERIFAALLFFSEFRITAVDRAYSQAEEMAKQLSSGFDDSVDEHDSFDVELAEASHDDNNFDVELGDADQHEHASGNGDASVEDPVMKLQLCCS